MAWNVYHDFLLQEAVALMAEPSWATQTAITSRLTTIRTTLAGVSVDDEIDELIEELRVAKDAADESIENRYSQLIRDVDAGDLPDPDGVMTHVEIAYHLREEYFDPIVTGYDTLQSDQLLRDQDIVDKVGEIETHVLAVLGDVKASMDDVIEDGYDWLLRPCGSGGVDPRSAMSFPELSQHMLSEHFLAIQEGYEALELAQADSSEAIETHLDTMWTGMDAMFTRMEALIRAGSFNATWGGFYAAKLEAYQRAMLAKATTMQQSLQDSLMSGIRCLEWKSEQAKRMEYMHQLATSMKKSQIEDRMKVEDTAGSLEVNISNQAQLAGLQVMNQQSVNQMSLDVQSLTWMAEMARRLESLYQAPLGVIERRTDVAPSIGDIANLSMQLGKSAAVRLPISNLSPLTKFLTEQVGAQ